VKSTKAWIIGEVELGSKPRRVQNKGEGKDGFLLRAFWPRALAHDRKILEDCVVV